MTRRDVAWYEDPKLTDFFMKIACNGFRGYHCPIITPKTTFTGTNSLLDFINFLGNYLREDEKRVLLVVDKDLRKMGEQVQEMLSSLRQIDSRIFDNVLPDPPRYTILDGVDLCKEYDPQVIMAIGGGSAIDTAKLVFLFYEQPNISLNNLMPPTYLGLRKKVKMLVAVPTTSGTGAETSFAAVVTDTNRDPPKKTLVVAYEICPDYVVLYPEFVKSMPRYLTMGTGMDAFTHAMGAYVLTMSNDFTDIHNIKAIELILKYLPRAVKRGNDMEARERMQFAAYFAGIGFGNCVPGIDHSLGHSFGALFHVHHGVAVSIFLCASVAFQAKVTERFLPLAKLFNIEIENRKEDEVLKELLVSIRRFMQGIECPLSIQNLERPKIDREDYISRIDQMVEYAFKDYCTLSSSRRLDISKIRKIYEISYENKLEDLMNLYYE